MKLNNKKIVCVIGPSGSGKDLICSKIKQNYEVETIVPYTTRPIRKGEVEGKEYHFISKEKMELMKQKKLLIEKRDYNTNYGIWSYATGKEAIDLSMYNYIAPITWVTYEKFLNFFSLESLALMYIQVENGLRLERCLEREKNGNKQYEEMCRRYLSDAKDFTPELIEKYSPHILDNNNSLEKTLKQVDDYLMNELRFQRKKLRKFQ